MPVFASRLTLAYVLSVAPVMLGALGASSCSDHPSTSGHEATSVGSQPVVNGIVQSDSDSVARPVVMLREIGGRLIGSGVVLTSNVVLMSAHEVCKYARTPTVLEVLRGNPDVALAMEVQDIIIHPRYVPGEKCGGKTKDQSGIDLALVFLRAEIWPTISANIASPVTALPSTVRCESHIMQSKDPSIDTQNYAFFPVLGADAAPSGYFMTDVNAPYQQHLDHGDSGGPCFTEQGDKLVGIVSAMLVTKEFKDRHGIIVDARQENFWILGTAMPTTDASSRTTGTRTAPLSWRV